MSLHIRNHLFNYIAGLLSMAAFVVLVTQVEITFDANEPVRQPRVLAASGSVNPMQGHKELPELSNFRMVAETEALQLHFDERSGHFLIKDTRSGDIWYSYPHPDHWPNEQTQGIWQDHLRSPLMVQTLDFSNYTAKPIISNWISGNGSIGNLEEIPGGLRLDYVFADIGISIPVEITIQGDYLQTTIVDDRIVEGGNHGILWVRLFPFLGAEQPVGQDGYMLIPDGSGAIIDLNQPVTTLNKLYQEFVYGQDLSYETDLSTRYRVSMPVYGFKSDNKAFLAVVEGGAAYAQIVASPSKVYSNYNWVTSEMRYRSPFQQVTNRSLKRSFLKYDRNHRFPSDRSTTYYFLNHEEASYAGMASRYRRHLMEEEGYARIAPGEDHLPIYVSIVGGDSESGFIGDRHVRMTTTSQAMQMVQTLYGLGLENMRINMLGWQKDGFFAFGNHVPVESNLGGNEGMRHFLEFTRSLDIPVAYGVNYLMNNTGANGFSERHHGIRNLSGTTIRYQDFFQESLPLASHSTVMNKLQRDLDALNRLGFDGITFGGGYEYGHDIGQLLISDYNNKYGADRQQSIELQRHILEKARDALSTVNTTNSMFYANSRTDHIFNMVDDYSHDLFSKRAVPFMQIALHGLVTYTSGYMNQREEYTANFLRDIEYGALPSVILTYERNDAMRFSRGLRLFNSQFSEWKSEAVAQYQKYDQVLGSVQSEFITDHKELAQDVFETSYSNGRRVIVNYSDRPYHNKEIKVEARNYQVIGGMGP